MNYGGMMNKDKELDALTSIANESMDKLRAELDGVFHSPDILREAGIFAVDEGPFLFDFQEPWFKPAPFRRGKLIDEKLP
jgi:hypothetical protein